MMLVSLWPIFFDLAIAYESVYNLNQEGQRGSTRGATHAHHALKIGRAVTPLVRDTEGRRSKNAETEVSCVR